MYTNISLTECKTLLKTYSVVPVVASHPLNFDTSLSVYLKVQGDFLLESAESGETMGRYSFIGVGTRRKFVLSQHTIEDWQEAPQEDQRVTLVCTAKHTMDNPLLYVQAEMKKYRAPEDRLYTLPPFWGGLMGYLGYETVGYYETISHLWDKEESIAIPDGILVIPKQMLVIDHLKRLLWIIESIDSTRVAIANDDVESVYTDSQKNIEACLQKVCAPLPSIARKYEAQSLRIAKTIQARSNDARPLVDINSESSMSQQTYMDAVRHCKMCINRGDAIQIVPSRQVTVDFSHDDELLLYMQLRNINPSPYMYYLTFDDFSIVGASPESMVSLDTDRRMTIKPIAGTIKRGSTKTEETALKNTLLSDEKERAEHLMLVDLARNDLHRIAQPGTVEVSKFMTLEGYSHVYHIVSTVEGTLQDDLDGFDLIRASFPAGTLSGAPKIEAMNIISSIEPYKRKVYGGMILVMGYNGYTDSCIAIRTAVIKDDTAYLQAGGGIVTDSNEETEWKETVLKLGALIQSIAYIKTSIADVAATTAGATL